MSRCDGDCYLCGPDGCRRDKPYIRHGDGEGVSGKVYTDAQILHIRTAAFEEAKKYCESVELELAKERGKSAGLEAALRRCHEERALHAQRATETDKLAEFEENNAQRWMVAAEDWKVRVEAGDRKLSFAHSVLSLIATPKRPDGTYNRSREACEELARAALERLK